MPIVLALLACHTETAFHSVGPQGPTLGAAWLAPSVDADGDGYSAAEDCDDADHEVHPGAVERCNGIDDACDGGTDEGTVLVDDGSAWPTLQAAVDGAPAGAEITVCPGTHGPLDLARAVVLVALEGPDSTTLSGGGEGRALAIRADGIEIRGFTITGGYTLEQDGGAGLYVAPQVDTTLTDCRVVGNVTEGDGGGLLLDEGSTVALEGTVEASTAYEGGGAFLRAGAVLTGGTFLGNAAVVGGGVALEDGAMLSFAAVVGNDASVAGGGVASLGDDVRLVDVEVSDNTSGGQGGGIAAHGGSLHLDGSTRVSGNVAARGGGGLEVIEARTVGGEVTGNTAGELGGGVYLASGEVVGAAVIGNSAVDGGGIATAFGQATVDGVLLSDNTGTFGGGLHVGTTTVLRASVVTHNVARAGGGIFVGPGGALTVCDTDLGLGAEANTPDDVATDGDAGVVPESSCD